MFRRSLNVNCVNKMVTNLNIKLRIPKRHVCKENNDKKS